MFLPYRIIAMLGLTAALATAWSVAPEEGPAAVDMELIKLAQGLRTLTEKSVSNPTELTAALADPSFDAIVCVGWKRPVRGLTSARLLPCPPLLSCYGSGMDTV